MRKLTRRLGRRLLKALAKLVIIKHKPIIIGIVGSGETVVCRELIFTILSQAHPTRRNLESLNVEFSLPLTIIGANEYPPTIGHWILLLLKTVWQLITLKPYHHFLVLELSPSIKETLSYWLSITNPNLLVICGETLDDFASNKYNTREIRDSSLENMKNKAIEIGISYGVDAEIAKKALSKITFYQTRIRFFPGKTKNLIIDATHYFYPISLASVIELVEDLPGSKLIISEEKIVDLPADFFATKPENFLGTDDSIVIVRGKRSNQFNLLDKLVKGNYE